jgi:hypothetical protein
MSFSRISTLALALAAGLAAPASAATYNINFSLNGLVGVGGSGSFTVADGATLPTLVDTFSFNFTLPIDDLNTVAYTFPAPGGGKPAFGFSPVDGKPYLTGGNLEGTGPDNPRLGLSSLPIGLIGEQTSIGFWSVGTSFEIACPEDEFDDGEVVENGEETLQLTTLDFSGDGPSSCFRSWAGTYTITSDDLPEEPSVIPLPATAALLPLGLVALGAIRRRKARE